MKNNYYAKFYGMLEKSVRFIERNQIYDVNLWRRFVEQFRINADDNDLGWRCEYWGKMMRGACMLLQYTNDDGFYSVTESSIRDILTAQDNSGRISTYSIDKEFDGWDLWGRKYVMLGLEYFLDICRDKKLSEEIITALCRHADCIIKHIGNKDGQKEIYEATRHWQGLNSCSILEPMIRLYRLTNNKKYLEFGEYIISTGFIANGDLIELAYKNEIAPHSYPVVKAYEMMSCFEGLLHYYLITGNEKHKTALINFGNRIIEGELSIIGCSGCTHELFDNTSVRQTQTDYKGVVQETCVTVTWMRFAKQMLELTGDAKFADAIEQSFYNAYLGSFNTYRVPIRHYPETDDVPCVLPFDSYSPLTAGTRGRKVGGHRIFADGSFYGCCACIGAAGTGIMPQFAFIKSERGIAINFYEKSELQTKTPKGNGIFIAVKTTYPLDENVKITVHTDTPENFELAFRIPAWCRNAKISINGKAEAAKSGYARIERTWQDGDTVELVLPMRVERILPPKNAVNSSLFAAYRRGPIILSADARITDPYGIIDISVDKNGFAESKTVPCPEIPDAEICVELKKTNGKSVRLINYSSAGKTWTNESACAAWLYTKQS